MFTMPIAIGAMPTSDAEIMEFSATPVRVVAYFAANFEINEMIFVIHSHTLS